MKKISFLLSFIVCVAFANAQTANYVFSETAGNTFASISATGTLAAAVSATDDDDEQVNIGFNFTYNSSVYTQMNIGSNGYCAFGSNSATSLSNDLASTSTGKMDVVAIFWYDLNPSPAGEAIYYETQGTAPNRVFVVEYNNVHIFGSSYYITCQMALYEGSNNIEIRYGTATGSYTCSASIGINESPGGSGHFISVTPNTPGSATASTTTGNNNITAQPADGVNYLFYLPQPDLTMLSPAGVNHKVDTVCGFTEKMEVPFFVENSGTAVIPAGDTIFGFGQVNSQPVMLDTFVLAGPLAVGDTMFAFMTDSADFTAYQLHDYQMWITYDGDTDINNDSIDGQMLHTQLLVDLGPDTTIHPTANIVLDATSIVGKDYLWSTGETTKTITVDSTGTGMGTVEIVVEVYSVDSTCYATDTINITFAYLADVNEYAVDMNVYPNPNSGTFTVVFDGNTNGTVLTIMDIRGQIIRKEELSGDAVKQIDMSAEAKGIYFIRVMNEHTTRVERVIVQ